MDYGGIDALVWPEPASTFAPASDALGAELAWSGVAFVLVLGVGLAVAVIRPWRARWPLGAWGAALIACLTPFGWHRMARTADRPPVPEDALTIQVRAYRWRWEFEQPNGMTARQLRIPVDRPVRLRLTSWPNGDGTGDQIIHGFSVPALRVRADVVPGRETEIWFRATRVGEYPIDCDGFCGVGHSRMLSSVIVMSQEDYDQPYICGDYAPMPSHVKDLADWGRELFWQNGCPACHRVDHGPAGVGPSLAEVAGYDRPLEDGRTVSAKLDYLLRAIESPQDEIVKGYGDVAMPAFNLPQAQLDALVAYLASISDRGAPIAPPEPGR